jgi:hypothetical protein
MRNLVLPIAFAVLMAGSGVLAASDKHDGPGTPGEKNCKGQTIAWFAQFSPGVAAAHPGLGGLVAVTMLSVKEIQAAADAVCGGGE